MLDPDADSARVLALAAIVVQAVISAVMVFASAYIGLLFAGQPVNPGGPAVPSPWFMPALFVAPFIILVLIGFVWIILDYYMVYKRLSEGLVADAETPSLVLGILQLVFGLVIPGILLIIAYIKIRDSMTRYPGSPPGWYEPYRQAQQPYPPQPPRGGGKV